MSDDRRHDFMREYNAARNASSLRERRVGGVPVDADEVPSEDEL